MNRSELLKLARSVLSQPTAPYHEYAVRDFVLEHVRKLGLPVELDRAGNVIARYSRGTKGMPLVYVAHMDHPGFEALGQKRAEFLGGVPKQLFAGGKVRFFCDGKIVRARITRLDDSRWPKRKIVKLVSRNEIRAGHFGMWDLPSFRVHRGHIHATAIDDVLSVAVVLATLTEAVRRKLRTHIWGAFTRAEEVGFAGAVALAKSGKIPAESVVISMEMSKERPWAKIGDGPVVRTGDRMSSFNTNAIFFLQETAASCAKQKPTFRSQRCLMDGGTCEATAFSAFGYAVAGLCLPLGNYHNIGSRGTARAEYVSVTDLEQLLELTIAAAANWPRYKKLTGSFRSRVEKIARESPRELHEPDVTECVNIKRPPQ
jgi:putative aminopeptidase FrvX